MATDFLYQTLATDLAEQIKQGLYKPGDKMPSVRQLAADKGISAATAVSAYYQLEAIGYIESRPKSGFYVKRLMTDSINTPQATSPKAIPTLVSGQ